MFNGLTHDAGVVYVEPEYIGFGYVQTTYIINENEGPVEVCLFADFSNDNVVILMEIFDFNHSIYIPSGATLASE